ncbi:MAG: ABC transporter permease [Acholeplasmataceae bacterium]|nr:ABC transporter permease [Acholeplasmataceae bacterium]
MQKSLPFGIRKPKKERTKQTIEHLLGIPYYIVLGTLIVIPILMMILYSIQSETPDGVFTIAFTLEHYRSFFEETQFVRLMLESLYLAFLATLLTLVIGYPLSYLIARSNPRTQVLLILLVTAPMWINMLLRTRALQQVFEMFAPDLLGSNLAIVTGMTYIFLPFMVLPIYTVLSKIDPALYESAADLGATRFQTIIKVILPLSLSGILSGIMMVFLPAATTLVVPKYLGQGRYLIGNLIENAMIQQGRFGYGSAIAIVLSLVIMGSIYLIKKVDKYQGVDAHED